MTDLVNDILEALEPYDVTMTSWLKLRLNLPVGKAPIAVDELDRAVNGYVYEQIMHLRRVHGDVASDATIDDLRGEPLKAMLVMAGRLDPSWLTDNLIVYAAHLAALTSYGHAVWRAVSDVVVVVAAETALKESIR
jgi:hypothetical protein